MDTIYIKMCETAEEIQKLRIRAHGAKCNLGKIGHSLNGDIFFFPLDSGTGYNAISTTNLCIWLPRQDQLQDMVNKDIWSLFDAFTGFVVYGKADYLAQFTSMEQLWLAFCLKELYNKVWDGTDWIKAEVI